MSSVGQHCQGPCQDPSNHLNNKKSEAQQGSRLKLLEHLTTAVFLSEYFGLRRAGDFMVVVMMIMRMIMMVIVVIDVVIVFVGVTGSHARRNN